MARCIDFATAHGVALAPRSGGHSYGGYSNCDGLVIDVSRMNAITVDTSTNVATVGAGAKLIDVYNVIGASGRLLPGGSCPTVGIAGLALGGGIGVFARKYGLTTDNIVSVDVVTADARHSPPTRRTTPISGGPAAVAVAATSVSSTSFDFSVYPMPAVTLFTLQYPWSAASEMLAAWQQWIDDRARGTLGELSASRPGLLRVPRPGRRCLLRYAERPRERPAPLKARSARHRRTTSSGQTSTCGRWRSRPAARDCRRGVPLDDSDAVGPTESRGLCGEVELRRRPDDDAKLRRIIDAVENLHSRAPTTVGGGLAFDAYGGAINSCPARVGLRASRQTGLHPGHLFVVELNTSPSVIAAGQAWLDYLGANVFDPSTGAYQNYIDPTLENWQDAYYGSNLARLESSNVPRSRRRLQLRAIDPPFVVITCDKVAVFSWARSPKYTNSSLK